MSKHYDALIIGGGHNGLVCAFYLARAGLKVRIVERRDIIGGAAVTEEFHPGFRNSVASYTVSLLNPKVIADMKLADHGYRVIERPISNFLPLDDKNYIKLGGGLDRTQAEFRRFSVKDAEALPAYYDALENVADVLRSLSLKAPPNVGDGIKTLVDAARQGRRLAGMPLDQQRDVLDLFVKSARSFLDSWFESEPVKAAFGFDAVVGNYASPDTPGSAYVLLHHVFGEVNGKKGAWGHSIGGMGRITQIMADVCRKLGVEISLEAPVAQLLVDGDRAVGARLESGEEITAKVVAANVGPKLLRALDQSIGPAGRFPAPHPGLQGRLRHFPHERRAVGTAALLFPAGSRGASSVRDHHRADTRLHGSRVPGRETIRHVEEPDRRDADPVHHRRQPRPGRQACRQPVLSAVRACPAGRS